MMLRHIFGLCVLASVLLITCSAPLGNKVTADSDVTSYPGHWPESYCKVTNVIFNTGDRSLSINGDISQLDKCFKVPDIWKFTSQPHEQELNDIVCDQIFPRGHFFTTYYFHGSNYFHLHYDTLIPLYVALQQQSTKTSLSSKDITLLPGVETERGEGIDWDTDAFMNSDSYWMQMLMMLSKSHRFLPLDRRLAGVNKTICFQEAFFGTPKINFADSSLLHSFSAFVKKSLGVKTYPVTKSVKPKIGLIHRDGRRKILNEDQLVKSIKPLASVELIDFSTMSVKEQIQSVQKYDILIGMNGAGLMNALYLPDTSVAVQLVPYKAQVNVEEFANLLKARGPYLEWHNTHPEHSRTVAEDVFKNESDTVVDVKEFLETVQKAIEIHKNHITQ